jgi:hypothetical protein
MGNTISKEKYGKGLAVDKNFTLGFPNNFTLPSKSTVTPEF